MTLEDAAAAAPATRRGFNALAGAVGLQSSGWALGGADTTPSATPVSSDPAPAQVAELALPHAEAMTPHPASTGAAGPHSAPAGARTAAGPPPVPLDLEPALSRRTRRRVGASSATTDRVNRILLTVVGLLVAAAGAGGILLATSTVQWSETPASLFRRAASNATGSVDEAAAIAMAVCLAMLLLGLRWAAVQLRPVSDGPRLGPLTLGAGARGRTTVPSVAVARAAGADLASLHNVTSARVRLLAVHPVPRAVVVVEMAIDADPDEVLTAIGRALGRLAAAMGAPTVDADLRLRYGREPRTGRSARVR